MITNFCSVERLVFSHSITETTISNIGTSISRPYGGEDCSVKDPLNGVAENIKIKNPVDLATGTGRLFRQILQKVDYSGVAYAIDLNPKMTEFLEKSINRKRYYVHKICVKNAAIKDLKLKVRSTFIISSFGFPSKIFNPQLCLDELKQVCSLLEDNGAFITIGWDETFNDELNIMWFKYIPDSIRASNFEEWRDKRSKMIFSPRNCNLTWYKRGLLVPLQFSSLNESAFVMGNLFGRDAAKEVMENNKIRWHMSLGITYNTKKELKKIIKDMEKDERSRNIG